MPLSAFLSWHFSVRVFLFFIWNFLSLVSQAVMYVLLYLILCQSGLHYSQLGTLYGVVQMWVIKWLLLEPLGLRFKSRFYIYSVNYTSGFLEDWNFVYRNNDIGFNDDKRVNLYVVLGLTICLLERFWSFPSIFWYFLSSSMFRVWCVTFSI